MRFRSAALVIAALAIVGLGAAAVARVTAGGGPSFHGTAYHPPAATSDFALVDHTGRAARLAELRGTPALLFFGFTSCPDVCPLTLGRLSRIAAEVGAEEGDLRILLVTVDPERDTPEALGRYVSRFGPLVHGFTGDSATLARMRAEFGVYAGPHPARAGMQLTHTPAVFGLDREGRIRVLLPMERGDDVVANDLATLLRL